MTLIEQSKKNIKQTCKNIPVIAIGGIDKTNIEDVIKAGADGVAVVKAVCGAEDIKKEAQDIKEIIRNIGTNK